MSSGQFDTTAFFLKINTQQNTAENKQNKQHNPTQGYPPVLGSFESGVFGRRGREGRRVLGDCVIIFAAVSYGCVVDVFVGFAELVKQQACGRPEYSCH